MADPDKTRLTEIELELRQGERLMSAFRQVKTYDEREVVIAFCEEIIGGEHEKHG